MKMTGLLGGGLQEGSGTGPTGFVGTQAEEETPNVDPKEQADYDEFVKNGMEVLYTPDGKVQPDVVRRLSTGKKPIETLAQTAVWLVMMLESSAKKSGHPLSDDIIMHGGKDLFEQLVDIDDAYGIHKFKEAEQQGAWYQALDMYREANSAEGDRIKPDESSAIFEALATADKEGRADEMVPGFYQQSEKAIGAAKADQAPTQEEDMPGGDVKTLHPGSTGSVMDG